MNASRTTWTANEDRTGVTWGLALAGIVLGSIVALLGYQSEGTFGAGIALVLVLVPLLLATMQRWPQIYLMLLVVVLSVNAFGFLTDSAIFFRLISMVAVVAMALRFAVFDSPELRPAMVLIGLIAVGTALAIAFHPGVEQMVIGLMWLVPFLGVFTGAGLLRRYPDQFIDAWYLLASASGVAISMVNLYQWAASGFAFKSYVIEGPFGNANVTGAMLGFMVPIYFAMMLDKRTACRAAGLAAFLLTVTALLILVSRTALGLALAAPILFFLRGRPVLILSVFVGILWFGWLQTGMVAVEDLPIPAALAGPLQTFRMTPKEGETPRVMSYAVGALAIAANPIDGYGFGGGKSTMLASGLESYGPENLCMYNWLEGGLWLFIPTVLYYSFALFWVYLRGILSSRSLDPFTYSLILCCLMSFIYMSFNGSQSHMALRNAEGMAIGAILLRMSKLRTNVPAKTEAGIPVQ